MLLGTWVSGNLFLYKITFTYAQPILRQVILTKLTDDEAKVSGCQYELRGARVLSLVMVPPLSSTVALPTGKNWDTISKSNAAAEYQCLAWKSNNPCEFTFTTSNTTHFTGNPFSKSR